MLWPPDTAILAPRLGLFCMGGDVFLIGSGIPLEYFTRAQLTKLVQLLKRRKYSWADGLECTDTVVGAI